MKIIISLWFQKYGKTERHKNHLDAVKNGVIQTGSVITSAGLILVGTFAVLGTLPIQVLVQFGM